MRTADRTLAFLACLIGVAAAGAEASDIAQAIPPRAIPPLSGARGPSVDLSDLGDPVGLEQRLRQLRKTGVTERTVSVPNGQARLGGFSVGSNETLAGHLLVLGGEVDLFGKVNGNVVSLDGDIVVHAGAVLNGDALAIGGRIRDLGGIIQGEQRSLGATPIAKPARARGIGGGLTNLAGLVGVLFTVGLVGFGLVLFARPNLELVSDTVANSVFRAFLTGLLAQVLVIPTFGMLITGLVLSVVGILLVPFVIIVVPLLLIAAVVGGFLAVAHAMGETHTRRRMAAGVVVGSANSFRYLTVGLGGVGAVWLGWIMFGWVPVAGTLMFMAAFLATWILATVGFGACLLSRAGIKPAFAGRYVPPEALTDEYLWATPQFGVTAAKRPEGGKPPRRRS
jgi:hypothetical protein